MKARPHIEPVPPGEMLEEEFMKPLGWSRAEVARRLGVPANRITQILKGRRAITPETAIRLEALFGWPAAYWLQNQAEYDLAKERIASAARIRREVKRAVTTESIALATMLALGNQQIEKGAVEPVAPTIRRVRERRPTPRAFRSSAPAR